MAALIELDIYPIKFFQQAIFDSITNESIVDESMNLARAKTVLMTT